MARNKKQPLAPRKSSGKLPKVRRKKPEETCFSFTAQALDQARIQLTEALEDRRQLQQRLIDAENHIDDVAEGMEDTFDNERQALYAALDRAYGFIAATAKTNTELSYKLERSIMDRETARLVYSGEEPPSVWDWILKMLGWLVVVGTAAAAVWFGTAALVAWATGVSV